MPGLPLFRIHLLAQLEILKHVDTLDIITLTFCSERTRALVESAKIQLKQLNFKFLRSDGVDIRVNEDYYMTAQFTAIEGSNKSVKVIWRYCFQDEKVVLFRSASGHDSLEKMLTDHLMKTFKNAKVMKVYSYRTGAQNIPIWKYRKTIDIFSFCCDREEKLSEEELNFILGELTINRYLQIHPPVIDGFRFSAGFQQKAVYIEHANWVHFDAILNSQSQVINLKGIEKPSAVQLNTMLKLWISMEKMQNLEWLQMVLPSGEEFEEEFFTEVLDGIVHVEDFQLAEFRRVDGKLAEVFVFDIMGICFRTLN